jgi:hypothetical protein
MSKDSERIFQQPPIYMAIRALVDSLNSPILLN